MGVYDRQDWNTCAVFNSQENKREKQYMQSKHWYAITDTVMSQTFSKRYKS